MPLILPPLPTELSPNQPAEFLAQGTGNSHWLLNTAQGPLVWRQFGQAPGSDHRREIQILQSLQEKNWVPRLLQAWPDQGLLMLQAKGQPPTAQASLAAASRSKLLELVSELWQHPCALPTVDYRELILHYWQLTDCALNLEPLTQKLLSDLETWPQFNQLTHHDLHANNLLLDDNHWTLLDWEYAAPGNPWIDAVALDRWLHLTPKEKELLQTWLPALPSATPWQTMNDWLEALEDLWQATLNSYS